MKKSSLLLFFVIGCLFSLSAREWHVTPTGDDSRAGNARHPFRTVNRAAEAALPGDEVIVHAGTYREQVKPQRSGTSEKKRIVFRAAENETVILKGSEVVTNWKKWSGNVWFAEIPNELFHGYNPYAYNMGDIWMGAGHKHTRGELYCNGEAMSEELDFEWGVIGNPMSWKSTVDSVRNTTTLYANFGGENPNRLFTEMNVRKHVICPDEWNLHYITLSGFTVRHAANAFGLFDQGGAVSTKMGKCWIIENCIVEDARTVGIDIGWYDYPDKSVWDIFDATILNAGKPAGLDMQNADQYGHHIVRNNVIRKCGAVGIYGTFAPFCRIENNRIEDINYKNEFVGHETSGIKTHNANHTVFRKNLIRNIRNGQGMWLDWGNQGARVSQNVFIRCGRRNEFEIMVGPILVDNNVYIDCNVNRITGTNGVVFVHNLFFNTEWEFNHTNRRPNIFFPHSTRIRGRIDENISENKWYNNLFFVAGLPIPPDTAVCFKNDADYNLYLDGAEPSRFDAHSTRSRTEGPCFRYRDEAGCITVEWKVEAEWLQRSHPFITDSYIGNNSFSDQGIETSVDTDFNDVLRSPEKNFPGPFNDLKPGWNERVIWKAE